VAYSCKGKLCPSCLARRTADTAAWLVDHLLPEACYRQWVLTFPFTVRFRLAADRPLLGCLLRVFLQTLFSWQRRRGRSLGIFGGQTGAVTFIQRFGSALNLNPHLHSILPDGLFVPSPDGRLVFAPLPPPTTAEVEQLTHTVARRLTDRLTAAAEERGHYLDPDLAALCEALFFSRNAPPGTREVPLLPGMEGEGGEQEGFRAKPLCASIAGFSLHAAQSVPAHDREALERLCRYGLRAPFSLKRLSRRPDGKVVYRLRRPWPNARGATHLLLDPLDFLRRLAALVSFPYSHQTRRHGVFANRSRFRKHLPPPPAPRGPAALAVGPPSKGEEGGCGDPRGEDGEPPHSVRRRLPWAQLLRRVLSVDALSCPRCSTRTRPVAMVVLAFLTDPEVIGRILRHLGLPSSAPPVVKARSSGGEMGFELGEEVLSGEGEDFFEGEGAGRGEGFIRPPP